MTYKFECGCEFPIISKKEDGQVLLNWQPNYDDLNLECTATWNLICSGKTKGCFQLESKLGQRISSQAKPRSINELADVISILRPGSLEARLDNKTLTQHYIDRKHGKEEVDCFHPALEDILKDTQGILLFQESSLKIAQKIAGFSLIEADSLRKVLGKKDSEGMAETKVKFIEGCKKIGLVNETEAEEIFSWIEKAQRYSFNKCLHYNAKVLLPDGTRPTIRELYNINYRGDICSININNNTYQTSTVENIKTSGNTVTHKLILETNDSIIVSNGHKFITNSGIKQLKDIKVGDFIKTISKITLKPQYDTNIYQAQLVGCLLAEGNLCHSSSLYYCSSQVDERKEFIKIASFFNNTTGVQDTNSLLVHTKRINIKEPQEAYEYCKQIGLLGLTATKKYIPKEIKLSSEKSVAACVAAMWVGDGSQFTPFRTPYYCTASIGLCNDLRFMLLRLGVYTSCTKHNTRYTYKNNTNIKHHWKIRVIGKKSWDNFVKHISPYLFGSKKQQLQKIANRNYRIGSRYGIPCSYMNKIKDEILLSGFKNYKAPCKLANITHRVLNNDQNKTTISYWWLEKLNQIVQSIYINNLLYGDTVYIKVKKIETYNRANIYDITVKDTHTLIADNILCMNSHAVSYALNAYLSAYAKTHFKKAFYASWLYFARNKINEHEEVKELIDCAKLNNIHIQLPRLSLLNRHFKIVKNNIHFGISNIKGVGQSVFDKTKLVIQEEEIKQKRSISEFSWLDILVHLSGKINKTAITALISSGALDYTDNARNKMLYEYNLYQNLTKKEQAFLSDLSHDYDSLADLLSSSISLGSGKGKPAANKNRLQKMADITISLTHPPHSLIDNPYWIAATEQALLGVPISCVGINKATKSHSNMTCKAALSANKHKIVILACKIDDIRKIRTKNGANPGQSMAFLKLRDDTCAIDGVLFPDSYNKFKDLLQINRSILIIGNRKDDSFIINTIHEIM